MYVKYNMILNANSFFFISIYYDDPSDILLVRVFQNIIVNVIYLTNHMQ